MKNYYAMISRFGLVQEVGFTHVIKFGSKDERDKFVRDHDLFHKNINNRVWSLTKSDVIKSHGYMSDGVQYIKGLLCAFEACKLYNLV